MAAGMHVFPAGDALLRVMEAEGASTYAMAAALGTTRRAVFLRRAQLGLPKRAPRSPATVWLPERVAELKRLRAEGLSYADIGRRMGVTKNQAIGAARRAGMATPMPPRPKLTPYQREVFHLYWLKHFPAAECWAAALAAPARDGA